MTETIGMLLGSVVIFSLGLWAAKNVRQKSKSTRHPNIEPVQRITIELKDIENRNKENSDAMNMAASGNKN